ncbi:MAG: hypothetical protein K2Q97_18150 [Burkholderiaceae bacterium]|nr:hypothetical protein [Burkholderiaceae bacterium]
MQLTQAMAVPMAFGGDDRGGVMGSAHAFAPRFQRLDEAAPLPTRHME